MARATWFVFDLGNVLIRLAYDRVLQRVESRSRISRDELVSLLDSAGGYRDLERGLITFRDFHRILRDRAGYIDDLRTFRDVWGDFFEGPVEGIDEVLRRVRKRYRVAFLSNSNEVHAEVIPRQYAPLFAKNDVFVFSHRLRCAKPDPEIFQQTLELLGAKPEEVLFVDDLAENVAAARNLGIHAFQFRDAVGLVRDLENAGHL
ncbi:MAG TPA: HAD family phosphatase [Thermoanaerobaculia bacterium]|nr:HAD family phosphatase [Thermoanaerobaculia bacterium]